MTADKMEKSRHIVGVPIGTGEERNMRLLTTKSILACMDDSERKSHYSEIQDLCSSLQSIPDRQCAVIA